MKALLIILMLLAAMLTGCSSVTEPKQNTTVTTTTGNSNIAIEINGFEIIPTESKVKYNDNVNLLVINNKNNTHLIIEEYVDDQIIRNNEYHTSFIASKRGVFAIFVDNNERGMLIVE